MQVLIVGYAIHLCAAVIAAAAVDGAGRVATTAKSLAHVRIVGSGEDETRPEASDGELGVCVAVVPGACYGLLEQLDAVAFARAVHVAGGRRGEELKSALQLALGSAAWTPLLAFSSRFTSTSRSGAAVWAIDSES